MARVFRRLWAEWVELAGYVGDFQARLLLTVFYFTVAVPFGLLARLVIDPLRLRRVANSSGWTPRTLPNPDLSTARRQF